MYEYIFFSHKIHICCIFWQTISGMCHLQASRPKIKSRKYFQACSSVLGLSEGSFMISLKASHFGSNTNSLFIDFIEIQPSWFKLKHIFYWPHWKPAILVKCKLIFYWPHWKPDVLVQILDLIEIQPSWFKFKLIFYWPHWKPDVLVQIQTLYSLTSLKFSHLGSNSNSFSINVTESQPSCLKFKLIIHWLHWKPAILVQIQTHFLLTSLKSGYHGSNLNTSFTDLTESQLSCKFKLFIQNSLSEIQPSWFKFKCIIHGPYWKPTVLVQIQSLYSF